MGTTELPWALSWIVDEHNRDTGFAMLNAPIEPDVREVFDEVAAGHRMIGSTSYGHFRCTTRHTEEMAARTREKAGSALRCWLAKHGPTAFGIRTFTCRPGNPACW